MSKKPPWTPPPARTKRIFVKKHHPFSSVEEEVAYLETLELSLESALGYLNRSVHTQTDNRNLWTDDQKGISVPTFTDDCDLNMNLEDEKIELSDNAKKQNGLELIRNADTRTTEQGKCKKNCKCKKYKNLLRVLSVSFGASKLEIDKLEKIKAEKEVIVASVAKDHDLWKAELTGLKSEMLDMETQLLNLQKKLEEYNKGAVDNSEHREKCPSPADSEIIQRLMDRNEQLESEKVTLQNKLLRSEEEIVKLETEIIEGKASNAEVELENLGDKGNQEVEELRSTVQQLEDKNLNFQNSISNLERKVQESQEQITDLMSRLSQTEKDLHKSQSQMKYKNSDCSCLEIHRAIPACSIVTELRMELQNQRELWYQKANKLEESLKEKLVEISQQEKHKNLVEERLSSELLEKDRKLQECMASNQALQNYVNYLKNSYVAVFADTANFPSIVGLVHSSLLN